MRRCYAVHKLADTYLQQGSLPFGNGQNQKLEACEVALPEGSRNVFKIRNAQQVYKRYTRYYDVVTDHSTAAFLTLRKWCRRNAGGIYVQTLLAIEGRPLTGHAHRDNAAECIPAFRQVASQNSSVPLMRCNHANWPCKS